VRTTNTAILTHILSCENYSFVNTKQVCESLLKGLEEINPIVYESKEKNIKNFLNTNF